MPFRFRSVIRTIWGEIIMELMDYTSNRLQRTKLCAPVSFKAEVRTSTLQYQTIHHQITNIIKGVVDFV